MSPCHHSQLTWRLQQLEEAVCEPSMLRLLTIAILTGKRALYEPGACGKMAERQGRQSKGALHTKVNVEGSAGECFKTPRRSVHQRACTAASCAPPPPPQPPARFVAADTRHELRKGSVQNNYKKLR